MTREPLDLDGGRGPAPQSPLGLSALRPGPGFLRNNPAMSGNPGRFLAGSLPGRRGLEPTAHGLPGLDPPWAPPPPRGRISRLIHSWCSSRKTDALPQPIWPAPRPRHQAAVGERAEGSLSSPHRAKPGASVAPLGLTQAATTGIWGCGSPHPGQAPRTGVRGMEGEPSSSPRSGAQCFN